MWKDIKGWEDYYEVNTDGEVRNKKNKKLCIGDINNVGYPRVTLYNKNNNPQKQRFFRHRLVAEHFIENVNNAKHVNHIDGDRSNPNVNNLEWVTAKENELHSRRSLGNKEYKPFKVLFQNGEESLYESKSELATILGVANTTVKYWLHKKIMVIKDTILKKFIIYKNLSVL